MWSFSAPRWGVRLVTLMLLTTSAAGQLGKLYNSNAFGASHWATLFAASNNDEVPVCPDWESWQGSSSGGPCSRSVQHGICSASSDAYMRPVYVESTSYCSLNLRVGLKLPLSPSKELAAAGAVNLIMHYGLGYNMKSPLCSAVLGAECAEYASTSRRCPASWQNHAPSTASGCFCLDGVASVSLVQIVHLRRPADASA